MERRRSHYKCESAAATQLVAVAVVDGPDADEYDGQNQLEVKMF